MFLLILMGVFSFFGTHFVQISLQCAPTVKVAPINYFQVVIAWVADILLFGKRPTWVEMLATFCIVFFTFVNQMRKAIFS